MAEVVHGIYASCSICRSWAGSGVAMDAFNVVCLDCAKKIVEALNGVTISTDTVESAEEPQEVDESVSKTEHYQVCPECGEVFTNKGKFLAHRRAHKRGAV